MATLKKSVTFEEINNALKKAAEGPMNGIIKVIAWYENEWLIS